MPEKGNRAQKKRLKEVEEYLKTIPPPPMEHVAELKMEKELKRMIKEQEKRKKSN